ncbi:hypothetical protein OC844_006814 [Tilletia horrida]|nr:hypothetical protein OC844_006814 [Tilletia horrida]
MSSTTMRALLPTEVLVEILVFAAAHDDINNAQRLELSRVCRAGHLAIHRRVLLPHIELGAPAQVHAFARMLRQSPDLEHLARRVTRSLRITVGGGSSGSSGSSSGSGALGSGAAMGSDNTLYGPVQQQADVEASLTTPLRAILAICSSLEHLSMDLTPAPLDYRLSRTAVLAKSVSGSRKGTETAPPPSPAQQPVWTWSRAAISHSAHVQRRTKDPLAAFRSSLRELVCMQNVLGAGDLVDQLNIDSLPPPTLGRWDRLESVQLVGPRFRLTCSSARTLALGLPSLKRLALVMPNVMPPTSTGDGDGDDNDDADDPEELGRDLFLRMSPLQLLIDTLCPPDTQQSTQFEHLLLVGHDLPNYVGSATKLRRWVEGLQYRVRQPAAQEPRYYTNADERYADIDPADLDVVQPRVQLITARMRENRRTIATQSSTHAHPLAFARWMLRRARTRTHWTFGPDHPSRTVNLCLRAPVSLNDVADEENDLRDNPGLGLEMHLADEDEAVFCDDEEREGIEYTVENFELPVTVLPPLLAPSEPGQSAATAASTGQDQAQGATPSSSEIRAPFLLEPGVSSSSDRTPTSHILLPHSFGPSRSSDQNGRNASAVGLSAHGPELSDADPSAEREGSSAYTHRAPGPDSLHAPDLDYVDAALRMEQGRAARSLRSSAPISSSSADGTARKATTTTIETIHPGRLPDVGDGRSSSSRTSGAAGSLASTLASFVSSSWTSAWRRGD